MRHVVAAVFPFVIGCLFAAGVPNCPDLDVLENQADLTQEQLNNLILCFCKPQKDDKVDISCLYGSNMDHLMKAADAVKKASLTTSKLSIQHMEFPDTGLPEVAKIAPKLESLDIQDCTGDDELTIADDSLNGLEDTMRNLTIQNCNLKSAPKAINRLNNLETLSLSNNKLESLEAETFDNKKQLSYLDVSGNFITQIEDGAFEPLTSLETLVIGDHNFINNTVVDEIGKLKALKTLDLSRADGIFEPPMKLFEEIPQIETLKLAGCSIASLEPGQFAILKKLRELDLRVNLIENMTAYAFDGLENVERLSLAGNYISNLEDDVFFGLSNLKDLDLGYNEIKTLPKGAFKPLTEKLKTLNLRHNPITELPSTGLSKLEKLSLAECGFTSLNKDGLKHYPKLEELDLTKCNISKIDKDVLDAQKDTLKRLSLRGNKLKTIPDFPKQLPNLEEIDVSSNPYVCDAELVHFYFSVDDRNKASRNNGKPFKVTNANETLCDRPYTLRNELVLALEPEQFQPYDESIDTTTTTTTTTTEASAVEESTTALKIPDLFVGGKTNDTLFKEEPRRDVYDLSKTDDTKGVYNNQKGTFAVAITIGAIVVVSLIVLAAVVLFMKKNRKVNADGANKSPNAKKQGKDAKIEDGMVEIELDSQPGSRR
ncbi:unnamed protein product [Caenorhabditis bovis]|uniref:Disease resistance R13L4/SHOC-2-like LRR domain-containing protein n=1 Tax=Caenorhabditis bovis TaxID=2654633 RepID=A0A8S1F349_9PELO|nr:unnamed protein product [Caenorhabditis bovis]